jgi:hypothetical protein
MVFATKSYHSPDPIENLRVRVTLRRVITGGSSGFTAAAARIASGTGADVPPGRASTAPAGAADPAARREDGIVEGDAGNNGPNGPNNGSADNNGNNNGSNPDNSNNNNNSSNNNNNNNNLNNNGRAAMPASRHAPSVNDARAERMRIERRPKLVEKVIAWQEKQFGHGDVRRLGPRRHGSRGDALSEGELALAPVGGGNPVLDRGYREQITARLKMEPAWNGDVVHTAVHNDGYLDPFEVNERYTTSTDETPSTLALLSLDPEGQLRGGKAARAKLTAPGKSHLAHDFSAHQFFYILASFQPLPESSGSGSGSGSVGSGADTGTDADPADFAWLDSTHPLCIIRATSEHTFEMKPGFNTDADPHVLNLDDGTRYEFVLENAASPAALARARALANPHGASTADAAASAASKLARTRDAALASRPPPVSLRQTLIGTEFTPPPYRPGLTRFHLFGDITRAVGFSDDPLYVELSAQGAALF